MCTWFLGAAVQGRWSGALGFTLTGRKVCDISDRGEGIGKSQARTSGVWRAEVGGIVRDFSKSEQ